MFRVDVPEVLFKMRVRDESIEGPNPYKWTHVSTLELFGDKRSILFALPGAFTPTCDTYQLPDYENFYKLFKNLGVDEVYCLSVNDAFVMNAWAKGQGVENVKMLPDGNGEFTRQMGMLVDKSNLGFGMRSWRYAMLVDDMSVTDMWVENGYMDNQDADPYHASSPQNVLNRLKMRDDVLEYIHKNYKDSDEWVF